MTTAMEYKTTNILNKNINSFLVEQLTMEQLIELTVDSSENSHIETRSKQELIQRGKDDIETRILIKKACKKIISNLELKLNNNTLENDEKDLAKTYKNKLLNSVSMLDKLQLEWQKYDLGITN